jgi:hypothetical protein
LSYIKKKTHNASTNRGPTKKTFTLGITRERGQTQSISNAAGFQRFGCLHQLTP